MRKDYEIQLLKRQNCQIMACKKRLLQFPVVGALGAITTNFEKYLESLGIKISI